MSFKRPNFLIFALTLLFITALLSAAIGRAVERGTALPPQSFSYLGGNRNDDGIMIYGHTPEMCPGDSLVWTPVVEVHDTPRVVLISQKLILWPSTEDVKGIFYGPGNMERPGVYRLTSSYTIPADLPPGGYAVSSISQGFSSQVDAYAVPFTVLEPDLCP